MQWLARFKLTDENVNFPIILSLMLRKQRNIINQDISPNSM